MTVNNMYVNFVAKVRSLGNEIPSYAVGVVWERQEPPLLNKWFNCNPELFLTTPSLDVATNRIFIVPGTSILMIIILYVFSGID